METRRNGAETHTIKVQKYPIFLRVPTNSSRIRTLNKPTFYLGHRTRVGYTQTRWWWGSTRFRKPRRVLHGLDSKVGERGLIVRGWAPQLLIPSHPSTGGFLSHSGWNWTAEAIGRGVPFLAWPIRGDQHYNAKLVVSHLKVGYKVAHDLSEMVKEEDIVRGIERLMGDQETHGRAAKLRAKFENGFPASSEAALDAFGDFIRQKAP